MFVHFQISHQQNDDLINMDPDLFGAALNKALNLAADNPVIIASMTSKFGLLGIILNKFGNKP